jgi:phosphate:Na+ symporter
MVNELTHEVVRYATELGQTGLPSELSQILNSCINGVGDLERIGDHSTNLIEMQQLLEDHKLAFSPKALGEFEEMFALTEEAVRKAIEALEAEDPEKSREVLVLEDKIDAMEKRLRLRHIERLNHGQCAPGAAVVFIDILSNLERVGDHAHNVACMVFDLDRIRSGKTAA